MEVLMSYLQKYVFQKKKQKKRYKCINVKVFKIIRNRNEAKTMTKHTSCDCKCKFNSVTCNSNQKWNNETCQCECKNYCTCKIDYSWNRSTCISDNDKYLKSVADTSMITSDDIISVMNIILTKMINNIGTNVSVNSGDEKVRYKIDCYTLHTVLLVIILLLIITIICYHYAKHMSKQKNFDALII